METNGGSNIPEAVCPVCGESAWITPNSPVVLPQAGAGPGFGMGVQPRICDGCGFVALIALEPPKH